LIVNKIKARRFTLAGQPFPDGVVSLSAQQLAGI
jgi:hypothetical protein